jgi:hypothetical protein
MNLSILPLPQTKSLTLRNTKRLPPMTYDGLSRRHHHSKTDLEIIPIQAVENDLTRWVPLISRAYNPH